MSLVVTSDEPDKIHRLFEKVDGYRKENLPIGDIFLSEYGIVIERKEYSDLVNSVYSKHLEKQLLQMKSSNFMCFVVIVGTLKDYQLKRRFGGSKLRWTTESHYGLIASKIRDYPNIHWVQADNNNQLKTFVLRLIKKFGEHKKISIDDTELMTTEKIKITSKKDVHTKMLTGIPNINVRTARILIDKFGSLDELMKSTKKELTEIQGIGSLRAGNIHHYLH